MERETKLDIIELARGYLGVLIIATLLATGVVSAMYAGDSMTFEINLTNPHYTVVGNSSSLEGLNVSFENGNITISPAINYKPDNFTLIFFDEVTREVVRTISSGGSSSGGGRTIYVDKNVTTYVPEYINQTVEIEKIVEIPGDTIIEESKLKNWQWFIIILAGGIMLIGLVIYVRSLINR